MGRPGVRARHPRYVLPVEPKKKANGDLFRSIWCLNLRVYIDARYGDKKRRNEKCDEGNFRKIKSFNYCR